MVAPFKGKRNEYQCPFCGRYASERNRYCSECFLVNPDQPGKPRSINVLMKPTHSNKPIAMVQLVAAVVVVFLLGMVGFVIWDKYQPGIPFKKDESVQTGLPYQKPSTPPWASPEDPTVQEEKAKTPTPPWASIEKVDNSKPTVPHPGQPEDPTDQKGAETNDTPRANKSNSGDNAENTSNEPQGQMGQEEMETNGTSVIDKSRPMKSNQTESNKTPGLDNPTNKLGNMGVQEM